MIIILIIDLIQKVNIMKCKFIKLKDKNKEINNEIITNISLLDAIDKNKNTYWCGTMQLCWNDLIDNIAKKNIKFNPQLSIVKNLNKKSFLKDNISDSDIYTFVGKATKNAQINIEKSIKEKFNEKSDVLNNIEWVDKENEANDICYALLKKEFFFNNKFNKLENGTFKNKFDIKYFGFNSRPKSDLKNQVIVLFYNDENNFAIKLKTSTKDEVIFYKNPKGNTFKEMYENLKVNIEKFPLTATYDDKLKIPYINFKNITRFNDLENKSFVYADGTTHYIGTAMQTINFDLKESGGEIKSEAVLSMIKGAAANFPECKSKKLYIDDTFTMFLIEKDKNVPYFAMYINDISPLQN